MDIFSPSRVGTTDTRKSIILFFGFQFKGLLINAKSFFNSFKEDFITKDKEETKKAFKEQANEILHPLNKFHLSIINCPIFIYLIL